MIILEKTIVDSSTDDLLLIMHMNLVRCVSLCLKDLL